MRVRAIWQQNAEEKMKKRSITTIPLLVRKAEERTHGEILIFTQQLPKCFQRPQQMPAICKVLFWYFSTNLRSYIEWSLQQCVVYWWLQLVIKSAVWKCCWNRVSVIASMTVSEKIDEQPPLSTQCIYWKCQCSFYLSLLCRFISMVVLDSLTCIKEGCSNRFSLTEMKC